MRHFCTYFDKGYVARGLALHRSLQRQSGPFKLWILCLDKATRSVLKMLRLRDVEIIPISRLEKHDPELRAVKTRRKKVEYYFTTTPCLPRFLLQTRPEIDLITYLDADLFFFDKPEIIFRETKSDDVVIVPHRFPPDKRYREKHGIFNVAWVSFRRSESGLKCLDWWRERCLEWCHDYVGENGRYADQGYLNQFQALFPGVRALDHAGVNLAPWNLETHVLSAQDGKVSADGKPLIFYHFHDILKITDRAFDTGLTQYKVQPTDIVRDLIYRPYLRELLRCERVPLATIRKTGRPKEAVTGPAVITVPETLWERLTNLLRSLRPISTAVSPSKSA